MSINATEWELSCDAENCNAKIRIRSAQEIGRRGWVWSPAGLDARAWIEDGDYCYCPEHLDQNK